ncbi:MAG: LuxR C-terminal-related transcriptional regulator [Acidimicrobiales bacterium]
MTQASVSRPALIERLVDRHPKLAVIRAPAGWGKTTLLADWHASALETRPFAWVSLDPADNDPVRFWGYIIEALRAEHPATGELSASLLSTPRVGVVDEVLGALLGELDTLDHDVVLVIDDVHLITNAEIAEALAFFVDHLPRRLTLAVSSRQAPRLPLPRLRARGELVEIDASQLGFSPDEAHRLLNGLHGLGLHPHDVQRLWERTEGWAAGLYLACLGLRAAADARAFIDDFAGDDRNVVDYLSAEVLAHLPEGIRGFLHRTSVLNRLCSSLCDAVTGMGDSARTLHELELSNLFLVPLDGRREWYRYHHLFGDLLRQHAVDALGSELLLVHRRAAAWHRLAGNPAEAIHHAIAAGDLVDASQLIADHWFEARDAGRLETLLSWLDALPASEVSGNPGLGLIQATTLQELGRIGEAGASLARAEQAALLAETVTDELAVGLAACRSINCYFAGDAAGIRDTAAAAADSGSFSSPYWSGALLTTLGAAHVVDGDEARGSVILGQAADLSRTSGHALALVHALGWQAVGLLTTDEVGRAALLLDEIDELLRQRPGLTAYFGTAVAYIARAMLHQRRGALTEADAGYARGVELARHGNANLELAYGLLRRAELHGALGDAERSHALVRRARAVTGGSPSPGALSALADSVERAIGARRPDRLPPDDDLSHRELAILRLLNSQLTQREIADAMYISLNTVKTHVRHIFQKLGVNTRREAVEAAQARDLLAGRPPPPAGSERGQEQVSRAITSAHGRRRPARAHPAPPSRRIARGPSRSEAGRPASPHRPGRSPPPPRQVRRSGCAIP